MGTLVASERLAETAVNVNHAHLLGQTISKADARAAEQFLVSRYYQDIPKSIRKARKPNPRWASIPKSFNLSDAEKAAKPKAITGESVANASMRMIHSRETARALYVLSDITGSATTEADELCDHVRVTGDSIASEWSLPFY